MSIFSEAPHVKVRDLESRAPASQRLIAEFALTGAMLAGIFTGFPVVPRSPARASLVMDTLIAESHDNPSSPSAVSLGSSDQATIGETARVSIAQVLPADAEMPGSLIKKLRSESGLTWDQLAKLFGVSRRSMHLWAGGGRMNSANVEQLSRLWGLIIALPGETPEARRAALLTPHGKSMSLFDELRSARASNQHDVSGTPWRPEALLDARAGDQA
jgi:DNA-binding transcriptional regulator YiaG